MASFFGRNFTTGLLIGCVIAIGVAAAAIAHDRVIWNATRDGKLVDRLHKPIVRLERIDAIRHALQRSRSRIGD